MVIEVAEIESERRITLESSSALRSVQTFESIPGFPMPRGCNAIDVAMSEVRLSNFARTRCHYKSCSKADRYVLNKLFTLEQQARQRDLEFLRVSDLWLGLPVQTVQLKYA
jgi:hypothetical protein